MARQIDADALLDTLKFLANRSYNRKLTTSYSNAYKECMELVKHAPTIEPTLQRVESVEIKHGHWIERTKVHPDLLNDSTYVYQCSNCCYMDTHGANVEVPYCWHCGAKMDEAVIVSINHFWTDGGF